MCMHVFAFNVPTTTNGSFGDEIVFLREYFVEKSKFEKSQQSTDKTLHHEKLPSMQILKS